MNRFIVPQVSLIGPLLNFPGIPPLMAIIDTRAL